MEKIKELVNKTMLSKKRKDELIESLLILYNVMPRISYFKDDNGVQFETHYDEVLTDIKEDGTIEFYVIDSDYQRNILTPVYVA